MAGMNGQEAVKCLRCVRMSYCSVGTVGNAVY